MTDKDKAKDEQAQGEQQGEQQSEGSFGSGHPAEVVVNVDKSGSDKGSDKEE